MAVKSKNPKIAIQNPQLRQYVAGQFSIDINDSGSALLAGDLCEYTSGEVKTGTEQNALVMGITRNAVTADLAASVEWGFVPVKTASAFAVGDRLATRASGRVGKAQTAQVSLLDATAGGNFGNQPANDGVEIVSSDNADTTQTATLYGTLNADATVLVTEVITITGTTQAVSTHVDWGAILAVRLSASCAGTITIREASGNATITTITTGNLTAGIATPTSTNGFGMVARHDASGASTAAVCLVGKGIDGSAIAVIDTLNGTTEEDHGAINIGSVTEFYIGAVASSVNVNFLTNEVSDASAYCGIALGKSTAPGQVVDAYIKPYWM